MYADLLQTVSLADVPHGSISVRRIKGTEYLYLTTKDGSKRRQTSLGRADDPQVQARAQAVSDAAARAKWQRTTVSALKKARTASPSLSLGRVLEVVANEGLFKQGVMLIGTAAYQTYPWLVGAYLPSSALMTNDADLLVSSFIAKDDPQDLEAILQRADPSFTAQITRDDKLPKVFRAANDFQVDILTEFGRHRKSPRLVEGLLCSAEALSFREYLGEESVEAVALYGTGVPVSVPPPIRYAIHKLLIAQERRKNPTKRTKDLKQAKDLIDVFMQTDSAAFEDALAEARGRGPKWRRNIDASLSDTRQSHRQTTLLPAAIDRKIGSRKRSRK
jgi:hypothetical protein